MIFQNHDLDNNKFFINTDNNNIVTDIAQLKSVQLSRQIYFRPSNAPLIDVSDANLGSCFEGYTIPTASFVYAKTPSGITCTKQSPNINLDQYVDQLYLDIQDSIKNIYQENTEVTLCYSGGIDSMVLLSYIMSQGWLSRTNILCFENITQTHKLSLHNNSSNKEKLVGLLGTLKSKVKSISWHSITIQDLVNSFNFYNLEHLKCYSTNSILQKYKNTAFIFGFHGNQIFLHKPVFVDEMLLAGSSTIEEVTKLLDSSDSFYTQSLHGYNIGKERVGIDRTHMLLKPWSLLDYTNGNRVYSPIGNNLTFDLLRSLDFSTVTLTDVAHVTVARQIIDRNVGRVLDNYVGIEGVYDGDVLTDMAIPRSMLDQKLLTIPSNLSHNQEGIEYINYELARSEVTGNIAINTLVAIKMLNWLSHV